MLAKTHSASVANTGTMSETPFCRAGRRRMAGDTSLSGRPPPSLRLPGFLPKDDGAQEEDTLFKAFRYLGYDSAR